MLLAEARTLVHAALAEDATDVMIAAMTPAQRAALLNKLGGAVQRTAPMGAGTVPMDKRKYKFIGKLKGGLELFQRPAQNRVFVVADKRKGALTKPVGVFTLRRGTRRGPIVARSGLVKPNGEFQLEHGAVNRLLDMKREGTLNSVFVQR